MKRRLIAVLIATIGLHVTNAHAIEMKPLPDVANQEQSVAMNSYILKRCSATYLALSSLMLVDGGDKDLSDRAQDLSVTFFSLAVAHTAKYELGQSANDITNTIIELTKMYAEEMQVSFLNTGNRTDGLMSIDPPFCKTILDQAN